MLVACDTWPVHYVMRTESQVVSMFVGGPMMGIVICRTEVFVVRSVIVCQWRCAFVLGGGLLGIVIHIAENFPCANCWRIWLPGVVTMSARVSRIVLYPYSCSIGSTYRLSSTIIAVYFVPVLTTLPWSICNTIVRLSNRIPSLPYVCAATFPWPCTLNCVVVLDWGRSCSWLEQGKAGHSISCATCCLRSVANVKLSVAVVVFF